MSGDISELFAQYNNGSDFTSGLLQGLGGSAPPYISIKDDRFAFVDEGGERTPHPTFTLKVIIIGSNPGVSRVYWGRPYEGVDTDEPPKCWSDNQIGPSSMSPEPQHLTCSGCPKAQWGSAVSNMTGKGIPACSERKKIAVIVPEHNSEQVWLLTLPPTSRGNFGAYIKKLASHSMGGRQVQAFDVVTELSIEGKELQFKPAQQVTPEVQERIIKIWKEGKTKEVTGANDVPIKVLLTGPAKNPMLPGGAPAAERSTETLNLDPSRQHSATSLQDANPNGFVTTASPSETPAKRGPGRPRKLDDLPEDKSRADAPDDVPAFLKARGGVVAEPEKPSGGLMDALNQAFKLNLGG